MVDKELHKKLQVLAKIAERFQEAQITWCVGASLLLYLKGIVTNFHDIDLMVVEEDALRAKEILSHMGTLQSSHPNARYQTKYFFEFLVDEVEIDVMADFVVVKDGRPHDCALKKADITEEVSVGNQRIPLHSIALWRQYYEWMEREDKVKLLQEAGWP